MSGFRVYDSKEKKYFQDFISIIITNDLLGTEETSKGINYNGDYVSQFLNIDLSVFSYSLGEVQNWQKTLDSVWDKTKYLLIIVINYFFIVYLYFMLLKDFLLFNLNYYFSKYSMNHCFNLYFNINLIHLSSLSFILTNDLITITK